MKITASIPQDRVGEGTITWDGDSIGANQEWKCRGKADNAAATTHGNAKRDPRKAFGDHPTGRYRVTQVDRREDGDPKYGPWRIHIQPYSLDSLDECAERERFEDGDDGIMIHGGKILPDGVSLRATYGCLRVHNSTIVALAMACNAALAAGEEIEYICEREILFS